jgi:peptidoglycan/xylan/chitin deacetylase (PgdA/CDA1 family)
LARAAYQIAVCEGMEMIIGFHNITENPKNPWEISPTDFASCILKIIKEEKDTEIHFDDGRVGVYQYALPLLKDYAKLLKPVVFVVPQWVNGFAPPNERYSEFMNWEELKLLQRAGFEMGSHSMTHPNLTMISKRQLSREMEKSKDIIKQKIGNGCIVNKFAYPYGVYNDHVINMVKRHYVRAYGINQPEIETSWNIPRRLVVSKI